MSLTTSKFMNQKSTAIVFLELNIRKSEGIETKCVMNFSNVIEDFIDKMK